MRHTIISSLTTEVKKTFSLKCPSPNDFKSPLLLDACNILDLTCVRTYGDVRQCANAEPRSDTYASVIRDKRYEKPIPSIRSFFVICPVDVRVTRLVVFGQQRHILFKGFNRSHRVLEIERV